MVMPCTVSAVFPESENTILLLPDLLQQPVELLC